MTRRADIASSAPCKCGAEGTLSHRIRCEGAVVRCSESFTCPACGNAWESDANTLPAHVEQLLLDRDGTWTLFTDAQTKGLSATVAAFRETLGLSRLDALRLAKRLPSDEPVARGIRTRIEALADELNAQGIECRTAKVGRHSVPSTTFS